jgi:DNA-binding protein H-NS
MRSIVDEPLFHCRGNEFMRRVSLKTIKRRIQALEAQASRIAGRNKTLSTIANLMKKHGVSVGELRGALTGGATGTRGRKGGRRRKVPVMYRNSKTGETWSGRGRPARWIAAAEKSGHKRTEFLVKKS